MKRVLARKDEEVPTQQRQAADAAHLTGLDDGVAAIEGADVRLDGLGARSRLVHLPFQRVDVPRIPFQRVADLLLEVVDNDKVREEGDQVLDAEEAVSGVAALEEIKGCFDAGVLGDDLLGDGQPELFAEGRVRSGAGGNERG